VSAGKLAALLGLQAVIASCGGGPSSEAPTTPGDPYIAWAGNVSGADVRDVDGRIVRFRSDSGELSIDGTASGQVRVVQGADAALFLNDQRIGRVAGVNGTDGQSTVFAMICDSGAMMRVQPSAGAVDLSCTGVPATIAADRPRANYFPLSLNAAWDYVLSTNASLRPIAVTVTEVHQNAATVRETDLDFGVANETVYSTSSGAVFNSSFRYFLTDTQFYENVPNGAVLPYMMSVGMKATSTSVVSNAALPTTMKRDVEVVGLESIDVPAGRFVAYKVHTVTRQTEGTSTSTIDYMRWFAAGVGMVRTRSFNTRAPTYVTTLELVDFRMPAS
jgi:hypothetical protein